MADRTLLIHAPHSLNLILKGFTFFLLLQITDHFMISHFIHFSTIQSEQAFTDVYRALKLFVYTTTSSDVSVIASFLFSGGISERQNAFLVIQKGRLPSCIICLSMDLLHNLVRSLAYIRNTTGDKGAPFMSPSLINNF